jgi:hypothetical protein
LTTEKSKCLSGMRREKGKDNTEKKMRRMWGFEDVEIKNLDQQENIETKRIQTV